MIYRFGAYALDTEKHELTRGAVAVSLEPQVFALLLMLIENRERLVGKDEIVERIWKGRIVSEAAIASRVKSARRAIGDDGAVQRLIRTIPKLGFRFVAEVEAVSRPPAATAGQGPALDPPATQEPSARPSIAVLPFDVIGAAAEASAIADALPHDLIAELSRLRWLFVIARGSSFRFRGADADIGKVRAALKVRYCLSGSVEADARSMTLTVELCDTQDGGVVWSERFRCAREAVHDIREQIVQAVIGALELQIPMNEARLARLKSPENLDAWSAYHLGLHHMYRFSRDGNALAASLFERAIAMEPGFARAHAGLSFTHFEGAFLNFSDDAARATALAERFAEQGLEHDPMDPFCNLVMGRAYWLHGDLDASLPWLDRAIRLNPSYAQARYSRGWTETLLGHGADGQVNVGAALQLSPLDPLAYGMHGVRAMSHIVLDEPAQAAEWAERAARSPGAHALIEMIAAVAHGMNGDEARARAWAQSARRRSPGLNSDDFLRAFPFRETAIRRRIAEMVDRLPV
ncbi:winged helix-turn-helix domain-containing protein [Phenylobacterium sp.]|uniref:winged helix-turn-helix domain-containing tetratricopeptide repeat protein n=1 Tax=Phenylobacterium sp. TaxID=1871053 RepID=UPI002736BBEA|nr:winged helix-turn-helix domain-containing protein [Phenylobacterium sp.]MDP3853294.1 winged helix-turn-helix domain-containing protein [Phenylobacterium sp.]